jgi:hypothetical protein
VAAIKPSTLKVVHPFETLFATPPPNFLLELPARELFHLHFDVESLAHSAAVDVFLEARNMVWFALGANLADVIMQTDMIVTGMACDQPDRIGSILHAKNVIYLPL